MVNILLVLPYVNPFNILFEKLSNLLFSHFNFMDL